MSETDLARQDLQHIRAIMNKTARFVSFSGYSALLIGIIWTVAMLFVPHGFDAFLADHSGTAALFNEARFASLAMLGLFLVSLAIGFGVTYRETKAQGEEMITPASLRVAADIAIYLIGGGLFGLALCHASLAMAASAVPLLYGLLLVSLNRYSRHNILPLALACVACGLVAAFTGRIQLAFLLSFGVAHIVYGIWLKATKR